MPQQNLLRTGNGLERWVFLFSSAALCALLTHPLKYMMHTTLIRWRRRVAAYKDEFAEKMKKLTPISALTRACHDFAAFIQV